MAPGKPLSYQGISSDIEKLQAQNVNLSDLLLPLDQSTQLEDGSLEQSYEFVRVARAALRAAASGDVDEAVNNISSPLRCIILLSDMMFIGLGCPC